MPKVPFFKETGRCPKILDYTLIVCNGYNKEYINI